MPTRYLITTSLFWKSCSATFASVDFLMSDTANRVSLAVGFKRRRKESVCFRV